MPSVVPKAIDTYLAAQQPHAHGLTADTPDSLMSLGDLDSMLLGSPSGTLAHLTGPTPRSTRLPRDLWADPPKKFKGCGLWCLQK